MSELLKVARVELRELRGQRAELDKRIAAVERVMVLLNGNHNVPSHTKVPHTKRPHGVAKDLAEKIYNHLEANPSVRLTNQNMRDLFEENSGNISRALRSLVDDGFVVADKETRGRNTRYWKSS